MTDGKLRTVNGPRLPTFAPPSNGSTWTITPQNALAFGFEWYAAEAQLNAPPTINDRWWATAHAQMPAFERSGSLVIGPGVAWSDWTLDRVELEYRSATRFAARLVATAATVPEPGALPLVMLLVLCLHLIRDRRAA